MDPFGISTSIAALLSAGSAIYSGLSDIRNADKAIENVRSEVQNLQGLLRSLSVLICGQNSPLSYIPKDMQQELAGNLKCMMEVKLQLSDVLRSQMAPSAGQWLHSFMNRLKWVFTKEKDVNKLRRNLEAHKGTVMLTLMTMQSLGMGRVIHMHERTQKTAHGMFNGEERSQSRSPFHESPCKLTLPQEIQQTFQIQSWEYEAADPEQREKTQRYMNCLARFINSGKFEESLAEAQKHMAPVTGDHDDISGWRPPLHAAPFQSEWSAVDRRFPDPPQQLSGGYNGGYNADYSINSPPLTPPMDHNFTSFCGPPPVPPPSQSPQYHGHPGWHPPPPPGPGYFTQGPQGYQYPQAGPPPPPPGPQPYGLQYSPPLQSNEWGYQPNTSYSQPEPQNAPYGNYYHHISEFNTPYTQAWQHNPNLVNHEQDKQPDYAPPPQAWEPDHAPPAGSENYPSHHDHSPTYSPVQPDFNNQWNNSGTYNYQNQIPMQQWSPDAFHQNLPPGW